MKRWYWIELIGFDNESADFGVGDFLARTGVKVEGVSILFSNMSTIVDHVDSDFNKKLRPCDASYGGYLHGEERDRQSWTAGQLRGLITELHKRGVKVMFSVFDFSEYTSDGGKRVKDSELLCKHPELNYLDKDGKLNSRDICLIKGLSDGRYFEDILIEKLCSFAKLYGFDGLQLADGLSSFRPSLQNGDMSDDLVMQFSDSFGVSDENLLPVGKNKKAYRTRHKYIIENLYIEWVRWSASRWSTFYKKIVSAFHSSNLLLYVNSIWTRDPFEAYLRYGIDYKSIRDADAIMDEWATTSALSSREMRDGVDLPDERLPDSLCEFMLTQQSVKACLPDVPQYTMSSIKDSYEQWELMNVAPMEMESAFFHRNNNFLFDSGASIPVSDGPWYCLSSGMKREDWERINKTEEVSRTESAIAPLGFLYVWSDSVDAETEKYLATHDYSSSALKYEMFSAGLCLGGAVRAEDAVSLNAPLFVSNPTSMSYSDIKYIEKSEAPTVILARENNIADAVCAYSGKYLSVWLRNITADTSRFATLAKYDNPKYCKGGSELDYGGIWTAPLRYNTLPKRFFQKLAGILNEAFGLLCISHGRVIPSVTASRISDKQYRILLRNPSYRYYVASVKLPFEIKRATVANKSRNHELGINGNVLSENLTPRGTSVIDVEAK